LSAMMRNQGDQASPESGSIIRRSSSRVTYLGQDHDA